MRGVKFTALLGLAALLVGCSKTVQWEEEVPLNTGEVIWVKRTDTYERAFDNNPFKPIWALNTRAYDFVWRSQKYGYRSKFRGPILLHVYSSENLVSLIDSGWPNCSGYGEFQWHDGIWQLQKNVNKAVIGRPRNLMDYFSAVEGVIPPRVTQEFIASQHFEDPRRGGSMTHVFESKIAINCLGSK